MRSQCDRTYSARAAVLDPSLDPPLKVRSTSWSMNEQVAPVGAEAVTEVEGNRRQPHAAGPGQARQRGIEQA